jgi:hypothetical protein
MAVRNLDGTDDDVLVAVGALSGMTFGTTAYLVKRTAANAWRSAFVAHTSGGAATVFQGSSSSNNWSYYTTFESAGPALANNVWLLVVTRKATGTATPRTSIYNLSTQTWTHANHNSTMGNWTSPGASPARLRIAS